MQRSSDGIPWGLCWDEHMEKTYRNRWLPLVVSYNGTLWRNLVLKSNTTGLKGGSEKFVPVQKLQASGSSPFQSWPTFVYGITNFEGHVLQYYPCLCCPCAGMFRKLDTLSFFFLFYPFHCQNFLLSSCCVIHWVDHLSLCRVFAWSLFRVMLKVSCWQHHIRTPRDSVPNVPSWWNVTQPPTEGLKFPCGLVGGDLCEIHVMFLLTSSSGGFRYNQLLFFFIWGFF